MDFRPRISLFFIYAGILGLLVFASTINTRDTDALMLCLGSGVLLLGFFIRGRIRGASPPPAGKKPAAAPAGRSDRK